jgi:hypothetical protein
MDTLFKLSKAGMFEGALSSSPEISVVCTHNYKQDEQQLFDYVCHIHIIICTYSCIESPECPALCLIQSSPRDISLLACT